MAGADHISGVRRITRRGRRRGDERGIVIVYFALLLTVLMVASAFVVDVGAWTSRAQEIQRTADAAALAGVAWMPANFQAAKNAAEATATKNGFSLSQVSVSAVPDYPERLKVTIADTNVKRYFSQAFMNSTMTLTRSATAEFVPTGRLGSPTNQMGMGTLNGDPPTNTWNAVSGWCTPKEAGDRFSPGYDANLNAGVWDCNKTDVPNYEVDGLGSRGYTYDFEVPDPSVRPAGQSIIFEAYDPSYNPFWYASNGTTLQNCAAVNGVTGLDPNGSPDVSYSQPSNRYSVTTYYELKDPSGALLPGSQVGGGVNPIQYGVTESGFLGSGGHNNGSACGWQTLATLPSTATAGTYTLRVYTQANQANSFGVNVFGLQARYNGQTQQGNGADCTSDNGQNGETYKAYCINVHGENAMTAMTITGHDVDSSTKRFYLGSIPQSMAGQTMTISLWDPGDGATETNKIKLLNASRNGTAYSWTVGTTNCGGVPQCSGTTDTNGLETFGTTTSPPHPAANLQGTATYNDRLLTITVVIPSNYDPPNDNPNGWWMLEYSYDANGAPLQDLTTWTVQVSGKPVHLVV